MHHDCDVIILTHRKHGLGFTVATYGTEGLGNLFIGTKPHNRSEEGQAIVDLFDRYMTGRTQTCLRTNVRKLDRNTALYIQ